MSLKSDRLELGFSIRLATTMMTSNYVVSVVEFQLPVFILPGQTEHIKALSFFLVEKLRFQNEGLVDSGVDKLLLFSRRSRYKLVL